MPLTTTIIPTTGRGLVSPCSILTIKSQNSSGSHIEPAARSATRLPSAPRTIARILRIDREIEVHCCRVFPHETGEDVRCPVNRHLPPDKSASQGTQLYRAPSRNEREADLAAHF